jgi:NADH:ubiquinone oxidoreductase subunit E
MHDPVHTITICMGSSCFSRGNALNVELIQSYVARAKLDPGVEIELSGTLCEGMCKEGPIVVIDGMVHRNVKPTTLPDLLSSYFEQGE